MVSCQEIEEWEEPVDMDIDGGMDMDGMVAVTVSTHILQTPPILTLPDGTKGLTTIILMLDRIHGTVMDLGVELLWTMVLMV